MNDVNDNPYQTPHANVSGREPVKARPVLGLVLGAAFDIVLTGVLGVVLGLVYGVMMVAMGLSAEEMAARVEALGPLSPLLVTGAFFGGLISVGGGYICARVGKRSEYRYAAMMSAISVVSGFLMSGMDDLQLWDVSMVLLTVASVMLGAHFGVRKNRKFDVIV